MYDNVLKTNNYDLLEKITLGIINYNSICMNQQNKIIIEKTDKYVRANISILPQYIKVTNSKIRNEFEDKVREFGITVLEKCGSNYLENFYENFKTVNIDLRKAKLDIYGDDSILDGEYNVIENKITIYNMSSVYHELFHLASTRLERDFSFSGFSILNRNEAKDVTNYFNEGYTQLLTNRYFNNGRDAYEDQVDIAEEVEKIIGKEKMEELYFSADMDGLISEFEQYESRENISKFFTNVEFLSEFMYSIPDREYTYEEDITVDKFYTNIADFLKNCKENKKLMDSKKSI